MIAQLLPFRLLRCTILSRIWPTRPVEYDLMISWTCLQVYKTLESSVSTRNNDLNEFGRLVHELHVLPQVRQLLSAGNVVVLKRLARDSNVLNDRRDAAVEMRRLRACGKRCICTTLVYTCL